MAKRNLYLTTVSVEEAWDRYYADIKDIVRPTRERIPVTEALGRVTFEAVYARCSSPLYNSAAMDGIAVISERTAGASEDAAVFLKRDEDFVIVDTGDPILLPYDAVIMAEDLIEADGGVFINQAAFTWQHVRPIGEDIVQGEMILPGKYTIRAIDIGVLLAGGITEIEVYRKPRVGIIPTGTEIVEPDSDFSLGDIIESNSRMIAAGLQELGAEFTRYGIVEDDYDKIKDLVRTALSENDLVIINAGSSAGTEDYTVHVLRELGKVSVHGVAIKPGKPVILAQAEGKPVIGLPGYPVSAYLGFELFLKPLIEIYTGRKRTGASRIKAVLTRRLVSSLKHREYVRVRVGKVGDRYVAAPLARGAGAAMSLVRADGFCIIPQESEGFEAGEEADIELLREPEEIDDTLVCTGSHDLLLDIAADIMDRRYDDRLSSTHVGSLGGLMALKRGEAHISPTHLLNDDDGTYNVKYIKDIFGDEEMVLIKGIRRIQGLMTAKGNPLGIKGVEDLTRVRYVNRQRGAGTRVLLDYKLKTAGIEPGEISGYDSEAATHMAVAAQVKSGAADCGMGVYSAASAMDLEFISVGEEEYDIAVRRETLELPQMKSFIQTLESDEFKAALDKMGGYAFDGLTFVEV